MSTRLIFPLTAPETGPRPMRGPFSRWPQLADAALAVALFAAEILAALVLRDTSDTMKLAVRFVESVPAIAYLLLAAGSAALYWRRQSPILVLDFNLMVSAVWAGPVSPVLPILVAMYSVGRYVAGDRKSFVAVVAPLVLFVLVEIVDGSPASDLMASVVTMVVAWYVGRRMRIRGDYLGILKERAAYRARELAAETQRAVAGERTRIARELHDVVAHRVSMMTVQAGAAKTVVKDDPEAAHQAMEAVEFAGRQTLGELRHLLGVLRPESGPEQLGLQPGLAEAPLLVDQLRETGLEIALSIEGLPPDLPARVDLSAYRIVQESLTNVLKHAGPSTTAEATISRRRNEVVVEVVDHGAGGTSLPGSGHGIVGMRERALLLGGTFEAGPLPGGGFRVLAHLPIGEASS